MKNAKKILALVLALTMVVSTIVVFAEEAAEEVTTEEAVVTSVEEKTEETAEEDGTSDEDVMLISEEVTEEKNNEAAEEETEESVDQEIAVEEISEEADTEEAVEEKTVYEVAAANLGDYIKDKDNWGTNSGMELTFKDGKIINEGDATQYLAYKNESFTDNLIQYKMTLKFTDPDGKSTWGGFQLRAASFGTPSWSSNNGYLVVIKSDRIEVQRWGKGGQKILTVVPNDDIKDGVAANISAGAVNAEGGVNLFLFVDGKCIFNIFDSDDSAITEGKYFDIYATVGSEIEAYDGDVITAVPAMPVIKGKATAGEKFTATYKMVSFGGEAKDEGYTINWYHSDDETGSNLTKLDESAKSEFGSKYAVVGEYTDLKATGAEYTVKEEEIGGFYMIAIKDAEGNVVVESTPVVVNNASYILSESVALLIDCELAFIKGEKVQIDPDDYNVMPGIINDRTLVPVRFVAESFGAEVGWDDATRKITIRLDGKEIVMTLGETKYTVDGVEAELDVPAQVMSDRTMVPVRVVSEAFGKTVFWDAANYLIIISDSDLGLDAEKDSASLAYIFDKIQDRI